MYYIDIEKSNLTQKSEKWADFHLFEVLIFLNAPKIRENVNIFPKKWLTLKNETLFYAVRRIYFVTEKVK